MRKLTSTPHRLIPLSIIAIGFVTALALAQHNEPPPPTPTTKPADNGKSAGATNAASEDPEPRHEPTPAEILRELSKDDRAQARPVVRPTRPGQVTPKNVSPDALPKNPVVPVVPKLFADGYRLVDRPGRLTREGDYYTFSFETRTEGPPELPLRLLPNRLLEDMEVASAGGTKSVIFVVSGELTEYHAVNYLLVQKLLTRPNLGNLK